MPAVQHEVDATCQGCGVCVEVCPNQVLELAGSRARTLEARADRCVHCGACVTACVRGAIHLEGPDTSETLPLERHLLGHAELMAFLQARRSVRAFKDKPVERALIEQVLEAAATAPMGFPPHTTEVLVIDRREDLDQVFHRSREMYNGLVKMFRNPFLRPIIRLVAGAEEFAAIRDHVLEVAVDAQARYEAAGEDRYTYHAPVLMVFHAHRQAVSYRANAIIVATYAMLAAHALGLGTTVLEIVPPVLKRDKVLRERWALPQENEAIIALVLGYPKYRHARGVKRQLKAVRYSEAAPS